MSGTIDWQVPYDEFKPYGGIEELDMNIDNNRNWQPWIYFEGDFYEADKIGNINLGYAGTMMNFGGFLIKNSATMDKDDGPAVKLGINLALQGE